MKGLFCCSGKSADRKFKRKSKRYLKKGDKYIKNTKKNILARLLMKKQIYNKEPVGG